MTRSATWRSRRRRSLRVLQERELERVGGNRTIKVDVRVIAATNQNLEAKVRDGSFREDLFYRLNVVPIALPSLREREGDLPLLIEHFLDKASERLRRPRRPLSAAAIRALLATEWKGNVRELEHAIEQAAVLASGDEIELEDLPPQVRDGSASRPAAARDDAACREGDPSLTAPGGNGTGADPEATAGEAASLSFRDAKQRVVERFEREFILDALARHHGNISKAAEEMGMYRQHLQGKLAEYGIDAAALRIRSRT